jgi:hypothetical protein
MPRSTTARRVKTGESMYNGYGLTTLPVHPRPLHSCKCETLSLGVRIPAPSGDRELRDRVQSCSSILQEQEGKTRNDQTRISMISSMKEQVQGRV